MSAPTLTPGTPVLVPSVRGCRPVDVPGVIADTHLTRWSRSWATVRLDRGGYLTDVPRDTLKEQK